jgi:hypothetical protein
LPCIPNGTGAFTVRVYVNDSLNQSATKHLSLQVNQDVAVASFAASASSMDLGQSVRFSVFVSGGTSPYTYAYTGLPAGCISSNSSSVSCMPADPGIFSIHVYVHDSGESSASSSLSLTVDPVLSISSFSIAPNIIDIGSNSTVTAMVSGGTIPYTYLYSGFPAGCVSSDVASIVCTPSEAGSFSVGLLVVDSVGGSVNATLPLTVTLDPTISSFLASPDVLDLGDYSTLHVSVEGGIEPLTYTYVGLPTGCVGFDNATLLCSPGATGVFTVSVVVKDSGNVTIFSALKMTVNPALAITSFLASPSRVDVDSATVLSVNVSGGTFPFDYRYLGLPYGCFSSSSAASPCVPGATGVYTIRIFVNDSAGNSVNATVSLTVQPSPASTTGFMDLPVDDWVLIAGLVVAIVAVSAFLLLRRKRRRASMSRKDTIAASMGRKEAGKTPQGTQRANTPGRRNQ